MASHRVGAVEDLAPGDKLIVDIDGRSIGVYNVAGEFHALRNRCAHQGGPLCEGIQLEALKATSDEKGRVREYFDPEQVVVCCPWHGLEFDVRTGRCLADRQLRVRSYETRVEDGSLFVIV